MFAAPGWGRPSQHEHASRPCLKSRREHHHHHHRLDVFVPWLPALPRGGPVIAHCDIHSQTLKGGKSWKRLGLGGGCLGRMGRNQLLSQTWLHLFFAPPLPHLLLPSGSRPDNQRSRHRRSVTQQSDTCWTNSGLALPFLPLVPLQFWKKKKRERSRSLAVVKF